MIDLQEFTRGGEVRNLSGKDRGLYAREQFNLDHHDSLQETVTVSIPKNVYAISTSFFCGMFGDSYDVLGREGLLKVYEFDVPDVLWPQIEQGLERCAFRLETLMDTAE